VHLDKAFADRQSKTAASLLASDRAVELLEWFNLAIGLPSLAIGHTTITVMG
jgi:hypothetical protein